jgi:cyclopropane fatty-acyl-phospholipid synthase-like methyltransferase
MIHMTWLTLVVLAGFIVPSTYFTQQEVDIHAPYVTTPPPVVDAMLELAGTRKNDVVYDLGCGDGRIVIAAAKHYGARGVGVDVDPERILEARENAKREGVDSLVRFTAQNVFDMDFREATLVTMYLLPDMHRKLSPRFQRDLKPGARIVTHTFDLGDWKPHQSRNINGEQIFLWRVGTRRQ